MKIIFSQILALLIMVPITAYADMSAIWTSVAVTRDKAHIYAAFNLVTALGKNNTKAHGYYEIPTMLIDAHYQASFSLQAIDCNTSQFITFPMTIDGKRKGQPAVDHFEKYPPKSSIEFIAKQICK